jgi:hypothetical protein
MPDKIVLVGPVPDVVALNPGDEVVWYSSVGNLKVEFDPNRCPFLSNVFQAPPNVQLRSGATRPGTNPGSYRYKISLNDTVVAHAEVLLRAK